MQSKTKILFAAVVFLLLSKRTNKMKTSNSGVKFIADFEGLRLKAYDDLTGKTINAGDPVQGTLTIGYGHIKNVKPGQSITEAQALQYLKQDLNFAENWVNSKIKTNLAQWQFDALASHAFNTGGSDTLAYLVNKGGTVTRSGKTYDLPKWWTTTYTTSKGQYLAGLQRRRNEEYKLYTENIY